MASAMGWANFMSRGGALIVIPLVDLGINGSVGVPFTGHTLGIGRAIGWENVALILGIIILVAALPLSTSSATARGHGSPTRRSVQRPAGPWRPASPAAPQGLTAQQAVRTSAFWLIAIGHGMTSMIILAIFTHLGLLLKMPASRNTPAPS